MEYANLNNGVKMPMAGIGTFLLTPDEAEAAGVSAFAQGTAMLAVSEETRDISGGFILKDGRIEVNCTFDALVRAEREQTVGEVAKLLFPEA